MAHQARHRTKRQAQQAETAPPGAPSAVPAAEDARLRWQANLLHQAHEAMFVWELGGPILYWNRGAELLYGYSAHEAVGQVSHALLQTIHPYPTPAAFEAAIEQAGEWTGEVTHITRAGQPVTVLSRHQVLHEPDGRTVVLETARDITDRKRLEQELAARVADLESIQEELAAWVSDLEAIQAVTDVALTHLTLDRLLPEVLERLRAGLPVDNAAILLATAEGHELTLHLARGPEEEITGQVHVPIGQGVAGRIAASRQPLVVDDLAAVEVVNPFLGKHLRSLVGVPLLVGDRLLGVLHAGTRAPHHFTQRDVLLLQLVGDRIALAIDQAELYQTAQSARQEAEERANQQTAVIESLADGLVLFDATRRLVQMNTAARTLLGHSTVPEAVRLPRRQQDSRMHVRDEHGRPLPVAAWPVSRVLRGEVLQGTQAVDLLLHTATDQEVQVSVTGAPVRDAAGRVVGAVCIFRDVTERRRLERRTQEALDALLAMARTLVEPQPQAPGAAEEPPVLQTAREVAQRLAEVTRSVLGCRRVGLLAIEPITQLQRPLAVVGLSPEQEQQWWADQEAQPQRYGEGADPELLPRFKAGEAVVIDMTAPPYNALPNPLGLTTTLVAPMRIGNEVVGLLAVDYGGERHRFTEGELALAEAVTQLAALVIERERLLAEREEARASELALLTVNQRMDDFLSLAAHDLRSPVASSKLNAQVAVRRIERMAAQARTEGATSSDQSEHAASAAEAARTAQFGELQRDLAAVERNMDRLVRLVDLLLDVARIRTDKLELRLGPCQLEDIVRACVEEQRLLAPTRDIRLEQPDGCTVLVDVDRISQVITNYLTNALRYAPEDRPITVALRVESHDPQARKARVAVHDEGPGIPPDEQERIWARFEQAARVPYAQPHQGTGLGLGLYISREIVEQHGGQVGVESVEGEGSTFWFTLPLAPEAVPSVTSTALPPST